VCSSLHLLTRAHCVQCSPSIPLWLASQVLAPAGGRTLSPDCALGIPVSHDRQKFFFLSFSYIKPFELGVEVASNNRSTVTNHEVYLLTFELRSRCSERINDAFVLLICFAPSSSRNPLSLSADRLNSQIYTICRALLIVTPSGRLPQKRRRFTKKDTGSMLYRVS